MRKTSLLVVLLSLFVWVSCTNKLPKDVLSNDEMEDVLYDYMLAQSLGSMSMDSTDYKTKLYTDAVFKKYNITESDFNRSMVYYTRHTDVLYKIYQSVAERLEKKMGHNTSSSNTEVAANDTTTIWSGEPLTILSPETSKAVTYNLNKKLNLIENDILVFRFNTEWIYPSGERSATCVLTVTYDNDSVVSINKSIYDSGWQEINCYIGQRKVKKVSAFVYQNADWGQKPYLCILLQPQYLRIREKHEEEKEEPVKEEAVRDSTIVDTLKKKMEQQVRDSLLGKERTSEEENHFK